MDQFQWLLHPEVSLLWEWKAPLLPCEARLAELIGVLDAWEPSHQSAIRHFLQAVEVEMAEPRMPAPGIGLVPNSEAHGMHWQKEQFVQTIR
jgi:hypothetical protein